MSRATRRPPRAPAEGTAGGSPDCRPVELLALCAVVLLQAALLVGLAVAWVLELVRGAVQVPAATLFLVLFALGVATVLVLSARALWAGRRWARSPVMTWQVLLVVMAVGWLRSEPAPWAVAVLAGAVAVGVGLLLPSVVRATVDRPQA